MRRLFLILTFLLSLQSSGMEIIAEPYLGFHTGSYNDGSNSNSASGFSMGGRGFLFFQSIMAGLDLQLSMMNTDINGSDTDIEMNQFGFFGGFSFPMIPVRAWMTWFPLDKASVRPGGKLSGTGVKFGVGIDPIPPVSFNMEYKTSTYDDLDDLPVRPERKISSVYFSVSFLFGGALF